LFGEQTVEALCEAVEGAAYLRFDQDVIRQHAVQFDRDVFCRKMAAFVGEKWDEHLAANRRRPTLNG
jgi:hypothetical protein